VTRSLTALGLLLKVNCQGKGTEREVKASLAVQGGCLNVTGFRKSFLSHLQPLKDENAQMFFIL